MPECNREGCETPTGPSPVFVFTSPPVVPGLSGKPIFLCPGCQAEWHQAEVEHRQKALVAFLSSEKGE